ncbi:MAG: 1-deoxy-D-xylulose-5-phosphate synthase [Anaerolineaceae bacterium]|nr:1-deoxy-D-xylulose-5-phosphate synthase [Anaerolineaceae bacterium]
MILQRIQSPADLRQLNWTEVQTLAAEIRQRITSVVSATGGHLASNLGVVELTLALHRTFDFLADHLVFDVGHQCYAHKLLTGRAERFDTIRQEGGLSGYPNRDESPYDRFTTGHAGVSISTALGLALADQAAGRDNRTVAVIGDGALASGVALEGLNHAGTCKANLLVVLNDNQMCISSTVGAMAQAFTHARTSGLYKDLNREMHRVLDTLPIVGAQMAQTLSAVKGAIKDAIVPDHTFEHFGFRVFGPVNGHNIQELCRTLDEIKSLSGPIMLHVCTEKGHGFEPAAANPANFHSATPFRQQNGKVVPRQAPAGASWSEAAVEALIQVAETDDRVVAITAAMPDGTGLSKFQERFPERFYDVGICESHAVAFAAGLAAGGLRPVVAIYSTFLQRAYDQLYHELSLNRNLPVLLLVDRAGLVGADGATHQGLYDIAYLRTVPGVVVAAPADGLELRQMIGLAQSLERPMAIRYPRDRVPENDLSDQPVELGRGHVLRSGGVGGAGTLLAYGAASHAALAAAELLAGEGLELTVVSARFCKPLDEDLIGRLLAETPWTITIEEATRVGGFGGACLEFAQTRGLAGRLAASVALPDELIEHASRERLLERFGLTAERLADTVRLTISNTQNRPVHDGAQS